MIGEMTVESEVPTDILIVDLVILTDRYNSQYLLKVLCTYGIE